jgi:hypothetical protein
MFTSFALANQASLVEKMIVDSKDMRQHDGLAFYCFFAIGFFRSKQPIVFFI